MLLISIFVALGLLLGMYFYFRKDQIMMGDPKATDILLDNLKDPLITSRAYFTEPTTGPIGDFVGYSPMSQDDWLHRFTHEEPKDERSEYDKIRGFI